MPRPMHQWPLAIPLEALEQAMRDKREQKREDMRSLCRLVWSRMQRGEETGWTMIEAALRDKGLEKVLEEC